MNSPEDLQRVSIERTMSEEKKVVMVATLKERIRQHEAGFKLAQTRITACLDLKIKAPSQADVLNGVIDIWMRVKNHHAKVLDTSRDLLKQFETRDPDEH